MMKKGWRVGGDYWWVRELREGDPDASFWEGAVTRRGYIEDGMVYAQDAKLAKAFDAWDYATVVTYNPRTLDPPTFLPVEEL